LDVDYEDGAHKILHDWLRTRRGECGQILRWGHFDVKYVSYCRLRDDRASRQEVKEAAIQLVGFHGFSVFSRLSFRAEGNSTGLPWGVCL
jgi:hypothetical protein